MKDKIKWISIITIIAVIIIGYPKAILTIDDQLLVKDTVVGSTIKTGYEHSNYYKDGYNDYISGDYVKAASNLERAIDLYEGDENKLDELADIEYFLARSYYFLEEYSTSLNLSEQSLELNKQPSNVHLMNCMNIGDNYHKLENYEDALKYYTIAENDYDSIGENSYYDKIEILVTILKVYQETENLDMILEYARKIDDYQGVIVDEDDYNENLKYAYDVMTNVYTETEQYQEAIEIFTKAKNRSIKNQDYNYAALMLCYEAELYFEMGDTENGLSAIKEGIELYDQNIKKTDEMQLADIKNIIENKLM